MQIRFHVLCVSLAFAHETRVESEARLSRKGALSCEKSQSAREMKDILAVGMRARILSELAECFPLHVRRKQERLNSHQWSAILAAPKE
jgi:hypothetical protein